MCVCVLGEGEGVWWCICIKLYLLCDNLHETVLLSMTVFSRYALKLYIGLCSKNHIQSPDTSNRIRPHQVHDEKIERNVVLKESSLTCHDQFSSPGKYKRSSCFNC